MEKSRQSDETPAETYEEYTVRLQEVFDVEFNRCITPFIDDPRLWRVLHDLLFQWYVRGHLDARASEAKITASYSQV